MSESETRRAAFIQSLRDCADFLEQHQGVPMPMYCCLNVFPDTREEAIAIAKLASWKKDYNDRWFNLRRDFGEDLKLEINFSREIVCRKVVTGTKVIPAKPAEIVETYEWACDDVSLFADRKAATTTDDAKAEGSAVSA